MFCISFHIMSKEEINCYLYVDQKYIKIDLKKRKKIIKNKNNHKQQINDEKEDKFVADKLNVYEEYLDLEDFKKILPFYIEDNKYDPKETRNLKAHIATRDYEYERIINQLLSNDKDNNNQTPRDKKSKLINAKSENISSKLN